MRGLLLILALLLCPLMAAAQVATLIADRVTFGNGDAVIASGNVEILYKGQRVLASTLTYDRATDTITFGGPITLIEQNGAVLTGDSAILSGDLQQGIVRGARLVLDDQMQLAAVEFNRVDGRYNQLTKAVASSCKVCANNPTPLWQIRARRVVHDQLERQLYFDDARFEVMGVPVAYFPHLRLPDPTLKRATGFLIPQIVTSTSLGVGLKFPYFIVVNDHADILLTPYLSSNTRTIEGRYRQELRFGSIELEGAASIDELRPGEPRGYLFGRGRFNLPADFKLNVDVGLVSDTAYLLTYGYSSTDRLPSGVELTRTRRHEYISASFQKLRSLRASEVPIEDTLATLLGRAVYERRMFPSAIGGEARLVFDIEGHERIAETISPGLAAACVTAGVSECTARDMLRAGISLGWHRDWTFGNGFIAGVKTDVSSDVYWISQDGAFAPRVSPCHAHRRGRVPLASVAHHGQRHHGCRATRRTGRLDRHHGGRSAQRGQQAGGVRRRQPDRTQPVPRLGHVRTRLPHNGGSQLGSVRSSRSRIRADRGPGDPRPRPRPVYRGLGPRRRLVRLAGGRPLDAGQQAEPVQPVAL